MNQEAANITEGTVLEGPHWPEPVRVLSAKHRARRIEIHAIGVHTQQHSAKLIGIDDFNRTVEVPLPSERALRAHCGTRSTGRDCRPRWRRCGFYACSSGVAKSETTENIGAHHRHTDGLALSICASTSRC
jgi:hypothetical protein